MMERDDQYGYTKERRRFGRQCIFSDQNELIFNEHPNHAISKDFIRRDPFDRGTQLSTVMAVSEVLTDNPECISHGVNHTEGGWPKDLNINDEEQTTRYRKKIMRDDNWGGKVPQLLDIMEKAVKQNAAVNIYEKYFEGLDPVAPPSDFVARTVNIFKDKIDKARPVTTITWSADGGLLIAGSYCNPTFTIAHTCDETSYVWNTEDPTKPFIILTPITPATCLEFNPKDQFTLAGGLLSGEVVVWDIRSGGKPVLFSEREVTHNDRVSSLLWSTSKTNTEFFSGSSDGSLYFWDIRKMEEPIDKLLMDPVVTNDQDKTRSHGVSVLEFEPTIPTRYMVGTDQGYIFSCNRKGKEPTEKIKESFSAHSGRVYSIERNPAFPKNFLSVGDWSVKIWSEEWSLSPTMWLKNQAVPTLSARWSRTRSSLFYATKLDGTLEAWDLLLQQDHPILTIRLSQVPLQCCRAHENGDIVAVGADNGTIYLVKMSDNLVNTTKHERPATSFMFERETRREKLYDAKMKEVKLRVKTQKEAEQKLSKGTKITKGREEMDSLVSDDDDYVSDIIDGAEKPEDDPNKEVAAPKIDPIIALETDYYNAVMTELKRREDVPVSEVKTPFDPDFDFATVFRKEDMENERKEYIQQIKQKVIRGLLKMKTDVEVH